MIYTADTKVKLTDLLEKINEVAAYIKPLVSKKKPAYIITNLFNGDITLVSRVESTFEYLADNNYLVLVLTKPMDKFDKFVILSKVMHLVFTQEAVEIVKSRAALNRKTEEDLFIYYNMRLGLVTVIEHTEAELKIEGLQEKEISRLVILPIASKAVDNFNFLRGAVEQITKQIRFEIENSSS